MIRFDSASASLQASSQPPPARAHAMRMMDSGCFFLIS
jgi:hypothetical protein